MVATGTIFWLGRGVFAATEVETTTPRVALHSSYLLAVHTVVWVAVGEDALSGGERL